MYFGLSCCSSISISFNIHRGKLLYIHSQCFSPFPFSISLLAPNNAWYGSSCSFLFQRRQCWSCIHSRLESPSGLFPLSSSLCCAELGCDLEKQRVRMAASWLRSALRVYRFIGERHHVEGSRRHQPIMRSTGCWAVGHSSIDGAQGKLDGSDVNEARCERYINEVASNSVR